MEQAAPNEANADDQSKGQDGDQDGDQVADQAKPAGDGAVTPGDRSAPDDEEDDHADQEGQWAPLCSFVFVSLLLQLIDGTQ